MGDISRRDIRRVWVIIDFAWVMFNAGDLARMRDHVYLAY